MCVVAEIRAFHLHHRKCENIYIGWGLKYSLAPFNPALPPSIKEEFPAGADIVETTDQYFLATKQHHLCTNAVSWFSALALEMVGRMQRLCVQHSR